MPFSHGGKRVITMTSMNVFKLLAVVEDVKLIKKEIRLLQVQCRFVLLPPRVQTVFMMMRQHAVWLHP